MGILLALPAWAPFASAGEFSGAVNSISPSVTNAGGRDGASGSHNVLTGAGETGGGAHTSGGYILRPGFGNLMARPARVLDFSASTGPAAGEILLSLTSPRADGSTGTAAAYEIRLSSVQADSPAVSEAKFLLGKPLSDFIAVPAPGPAGYTQQISVTGLLGGASYYFAVKARAAWDAWGALSNGTTVQTRLYAPVTSGFSAVVDDSIRLDWGAAPNISGLQYRVLVSTAPDPLAPGGALVSSSDTYNLYLSTSGLAGDTTYYFRVAAMNNSGLPLAYSAIAATSTLLAFDPLFNNFTAMAANALRVNWDENGNRYPGTAYRVAYSTAPDPLLPDGADVFLAETGERYLDVAGLDADTTYYFRVAGLNHNGIESGYSAAAGTATLASLPVFAGFSEISAVSVRFNWSANGNREPGTLYNVLVSTAPDPLNPSGAEVTSSDTYDVFYTSAGLNPDTDYYFRVAAINGNGVWTAYTPPQKVSTIFVASPFLWSVGTPAGSTGVISPAWPVHQAGDVALLFIETANQPVTFSNAAGFTEVSGSPQGTGPSGNTVATMMSVFWARATSSSMGAPTTNDPGNHAYGVILVFRNVVESGDPVSAFSGGFKTPQSLSVVIPGPVTSEPETLVVTGLATDVDSTASFASNWYSDVLENLTERFDGGITTMNGGGLAVVTGNMRQAGSVGNITADVSNSVNGFVSVALKPKPPLPPPDPGAITDVQARSITASWSLVAGATGYRLAAATTEDNPPAIYASSTTLGDLSATVSNPVLNPNTTYYLFVRSNGPGESSVYAAFLATSTLVEYSPSLPAFSGVTDSSVQFGWNRNNNPADITRYRVYASTAADPLAPDGALYTSSDTFNLFYSSAGLAPDTEYFFSVAGVNNNEVPTAYTGAVSTYTLLAFPPAFDAFTNLSTGSVSFGWQHNGNRDGTRYRAELAGAENMAGAVSSGTYNIFWSSAGLAANTTYYFRVAGVNKGGVATGYTAVKATATWARQPAAPFLDGIGESAIQLNWDRNDNPSGLTLYRVAVSTAEDPLDPQGAAVTYGETYGLALSSAGLALNTTYYFRAAAVNHNGVESAYAAVQSTSTFAVQPSGLSFTQVSSHSLRLDWSQGANPAPRTVYRVVYSTAIDPLNPGTAAAFTAHTGAAFLLAENLLPNASYYFKAAAVSNNGVPTAYAELSTATLAARPAGLYFTDMASHTVRLNWSQEGNPAPATLYRVAVSTAADPLDPLGAQVAFYDTYAASAAPSGLAANTTYYFRVAAFNRRGILTAYAAAASTSSLAAQPSGFYFTGVTQAEIQANWSDSGNGPGALYRVAVSTAPDPLSPDGAPVTFHDTYDVFLTTAGLTTFTDYYFRAAAFNNNGVMTAYTDAVTQKTLGLGEIGSPASGSIDAVYVSSIAASWDLVAGATSYTLAASLSPVNPPVSVYASSVTLGNAVTSAYVFSPALAADTTYYLFVQASGGNVSGDWFAFPGAATLLANVPAFNAFSNLAQDGVRFSWFHNGNLAGTHYRVLTSTAPDPLNPGDAVSVSSDTYNLFLSTAGLAANTTYYFRVAGVNKGGIETAYALAQATATLAQQPAFGAFSGVLYNAMDLSWTGGVNPPGTLYHALVSTAPDPLNPGQALVTSSYTYNLSLSSAGLTPDTTYYLRAAAVNHGATYTPYSVAAGTATRLQHAPAFQAFGSVTSSGIQFSWTDSNPGGTRYRVYVSTAADPLAPDGAVVSSSDTYNLSLSSAGLVPNTTYYFRTAGVNKSNVPTAFTAAAATATLANTPLTAVTTFSAVTESGFTAAWEPAGNPPGTLYIVQVSTAQNFNAGATDQVTAATAPVQGTSYSFTGLTPYTLYYFQARAVNRNGAATGDAQLGSVTTLVLPPPGGGAVTAVTTFSVAASWNLSAAATGYTLVASTASPLPPYPIAASSTTLGDLGAILPGLTLNTTYHLFLRANGRGMSSEWSAFAATATVANAPLTAVTTFTAVQYYGFDVSWNNNSNPLDSTLYDVQVSTAFNFNEGATDQVSFTTAPAAGPGASFNALSDGTFYYFRVRTRGHGGVLSDWRELGVQRTKALPVVHKGGDGLLFHGQAGNATPQFSKYLEATDIFSGAEAPPSGEAGTLYVIKPGTLQSKQEAVAAYVAGNTLHVLCTDGANWSEEWTQNVGGDASTRRFDIAYENDSGDVIVVYSQGQAGGNELGYRTKPGAAECGALNWSAHNDLDPVRTSGEVQWVKLASDRRVSSDTVAAVWADANSDLSAAVWNGSAWEAEPAAALETSLEFVSASHDVEDFDVEFESLSGNAMVVWGNALGTNGTNGLWYARWLEASRTWGAPTNAAPAGGDDATNLDLAPNPNTNEMLLGTVGNAGGTGSADVRGGYWSGSAWTVAALDTAAQLPAARTKMVAAAWISSGTYTRGLLAYNDAATTNVGWYVWFGSSFVAQTDVAPAPAFGNPQNVYVMQQDPVYKNKAVLAVSDARRYLIAKQAEMTSAGVITWSDAFGGAPLDVNLATGSIGAFSFAFWPSSPTTTLAQSAYRFFANDNSADVGAPLAAQNAIGAVDAEGQAFRLRTAVHIAQLDLPVSGQAFKLQFAGRGDGTCELPSNGTPADYVDVTGATAIAFNDNAAPADGAALTVNAADPTHGAHTNRPQSYEESGTFTNSVSGVTRNQDALWDFSLKENGMTPGEVYCLRVVKDDGAALNGYEVYPQLILNAPVYINEVYPSAVADGEDWVEFYNAGDSTPSLSGWKLEYIQNTIETGGSPNPLWTGQLGDVVNARSTFTVTGLTLSGPTRYHVRLLDAGNRLVNQVQWPPLSPGQSFARIADGDPTYFEIDPTPTPGYANAVSTDPFKINEVSYGELGRQFVEIYNDSAVTRSFHGYTLRNSAGPARGAFELNRKIYPRAYALVDASGLDAGGRSYADAFGEQGLASAGDFLVLENSSGSVVDALTWQADANYTRYDYRGSTVSYSAAAPAGAAHSIGRGALAEGYDSGVDQDDFAVRAVPTPGGRHYNAGTLTANALDYPVNTAQPQYLSRVFPLTLTLGVNSSAGYANTVVFQRTGGAADVYSPHVYRLSDIGFNTAQAGQEQSVAQTGLSFNDQDGRPLAAGAVYRVAFHTDDGSASAPQILLTTVTYDASVHAAAAASSAPARMNDASRAAVLRLTVTNNSPSGANALHVATVTFNLLDQDLNALTQTQARNLFNAVMLAADSPSGTAGLYEPNIDFSTAAYVPKASLFVEAGTGGSTLTVSSEYLWAAAAAAGGSSYFYVVVESTQDASDWPVKTFRARLDPAGAVLHDAAGGLAQAFTPAAAVNSSSVTLIAPAQRPAGTAWPYVSPSSAPVTTLTGLEWSGLVSLRSYVTSSDGILRALDENGRLIWASTTSPLSPIYTSPTDSQDEGGEAYLYFANDLGDVYKIWDKGDTSEVKWKRSLNTQIRSNPVVSGTRLYFGGADSKVHCIDMYSADGALCPGWTDLPVTGVISGTPMIDNRTGVNAGWIGTEDGRLVQFNTVTGGGAVTLNTGGAIRTSPFGDTGYSGSTNKVFVTSTDGKLYVAPLDLSDSVAAFDAGPGNAIYSSPYVANFGGGKYVFFGDNAGRLHKVSTTTWLDDTGAGWPFQAGGAIRTLPVPMQAGWQGLPAGQDHVYFGCDDGYIYAVNIHTGQLRDGWPVATGGPVRGDLVFDGLTLIVSSMDGRTYGIYIGP